MPLKAKVDEEKKAKLESIEHMLNALSTIRQMEADWLGAVNEYASKVCGYDRHWTTIIGAEAWLRTEGTRG